MRFFNINQWEGPSNKIDVHLRRANPERPVYECVNFYQKLFEILKLDCMRFGEFTQLNVEGSGTIPAWTYSYNGEHVLVTVNYCGYRSPNQATISFKELLSEQVYYRDSQELRNKGIYVLLEPYQVQILKY